MSHPNSPQGDSILAAARAALKEAKAVVAPGTPREPAGNDPKPTGNPLVPNEELLEKIDGVLQAASAELASAEPLPPPEIPTEPPQAPQAPIVYLSAPPPPANMASLFQKFNDVPTQLRESSHVNTFEIKKLNLAAILESLERAVQSHESMPSPDAAFAVSSLSEQVMKLTKDVEKSQDPAKLYRKIDKDILTKMVEHMIYTVGTEMKWLMTETEKVVPVERQALMMKTIQAATLRIGPSLNEVLEIAQTRLLKVFDLKEVKDEEAPREP
jgi:hypothetical protein